MRATINREWAFDDVALGALLGAWLGADQSAWKVPYHGFAAAVTAFTIVYFSRQMTVGSNRAARKSAGVICVFAMGWGVALVLLKWAAPLTALDFLAILGLWGASLAMRWVADDGKGKEASGSGPTTPVDHSNKMQGPGSAPPMP